MNIKLDAISTRTLEFVIVVLTAFGALYLHLESIHADRLETKKTDLRLEQQILTNELNRDNFARRRYEQSIAEGTASEGDQVRLEYLEMQIQNRMAEKKNC
jgi:hypothetical protein